MFAISPLFHFLSGILCWGGTLTVFLLSFLFSHELDGFNLLGDVGGGVRLKLCVTARWFLSVIQPLSYLSSLTVK